MTDYNTAMWLHLGLSIFQEVERASKLSTGRKTRRKKAEGDTGEGPKTSNRVELTQSTVKFADIGGSEAALLVSVITTITIPANENNPHPAPSGATCKINLKKFFAASLIAVVLP